MGVDTWPKVIVTAVAAPLALLVLSTLFIPGIIERANRTEAERAARLKKAVDIGDRNRDFTSQLHVLKTRMHMFNSRAVRQRLSPAELRRAQRSFEKEHTDDYLLLDKMAWWWFWDLEREGEIFNLLTSKELSALHTLLEDYGKNAEASVGVISPLWQFLSSSQYSLANKRQRDIERMESEMNTGLHELSQRRTQLVKDIAACFAQSRCEASTTRPTPTPSVTK